jgi:hypothetical protein
MPRPKCTVPLKLFAVVLPLLLGGCGWVKTMQFPSPSGKAAIEIWQTGLDNGMGARVELVTAQRRTLLVEVPDDSFIHFAHAYWSPGETKVGIFCSGSVLIRAAARVATGSAIPFGQIRDELAQSIRDTYQRPAGEDPFNWSADSSAVRQFFKLHPEIRVSYR